MITNCYDLLMNDEGFPMLLLKKEDRKTVKCPDDIANFVRTEFNANCLAEEHVWVIGTNAALNSLAVFEVSHGDSVCCTVNTRGIFTRLLLVGATSFMVVHNHPSGSLTASAADVEAFNNLREAGKLLGLTLCDFIILGDGVMSFRDSPYWNQEVSV